MATVQGTAKLLKLKKDLETLSPSDRLRVAAHLIDKGEYALAETIVGNVVAGLSLDRRLRT